MRETARTGEVGRPPEGAEPTAPTSTPSPPARPVDQLGDAPEDVAEFVRRLNAEIKRLEVRRRERIEREAEGELVPLADVRRFWAGQVEAVKARHRALPGLLAPRLAGRPRAEVYEVLEAELHALLAALATEVTL